MQRREKTKSKAAAPAPSGHTQPRSVTVLTDLREALNSLAGELEASRLLGAAVNAVAARPGYGRLAADIKAEMERIVRERAG